MTLKECYQILKVDQAASLEDVKRAYRRRAFELHPDLNPHVRDASRQFQQLNEAYVILNRLVAARESAEQRRQEQPQDQSFASRWNSWSFSFGGKKAEPKADQKADPKADARSENARAESAEDRRAEREEAYREEMRREEARRREEKIRAIREEEAKRERQAKERAAEQEKQEKERQEQERLEKERLEKERRTERDIPPRPGATRPEAAEGTARSETERTERSERHERPEAERPGAQRPTRPTADDNMYAEQQEVLRDILNDSFARRVFEDIYSEIRKKAPQPEHTEAPRPEASRKEARERTVLRPEAVSAPPPSPPKSGFSLGLEQFGLDFSKGMGNTVKGWLRSQIDEEQTIRLPATGLFPGARVRLQIRRGLSDELTTLEVVLPADFVVGKPIRLRGMGKKLGSVQGDLYLTVLSR